MDKMSMEELGFFLYMEEMERQQQEEQQPRTPANRKNSRKRNSRPPNFQQSECRQKTSCDT